MLFLLALTESNDMHSIYGENPAAEEKWSLKSAGKNIGRSDGRRHHHHDCVTDIGPLLTPLNTLQALLAGLLMVLVVFAAMS